jgi:hypothetical protein
MPLFLTGEKMTKNAILLLIIIFSFMCTACNGESEKQKQDARIKKIETLKKNCKENEHIEVWKVKSINEKPGGVREVSLNALDKVAEQKIMVEGFNDLEPGMEVIIKVTVTDLSLNKKYGDSSVAREFLTIVDY